MLSYTGIHFLRRIAVHLALGKSTPAPGNQRGDRVVHGDVDLIEKLGRNDLCPCGSGLRFQTLLFEVRPL